MCSHIFMALGMWDDVVEANVAAIRVNNQHEQARGFPDVNCGHYAEWLEYGYFQQGRLRAALQMVAACQRTDTESATWAAAHSGQPPYGAKDAAHLHRNLVNEFAVMQDMAVIESQDQSLPSTFDTSLLRPYNAAEHNFTLAYAAARRGDLSAAHSAFQTMHANIEASRSEPEADPTDLQTLAVAADELSGLVQVTSGNYEAGIAQIRHAMETYHGMAFAFGPPVTLKPPAELLGDLLLQHGDAAAARHGFELSLQRAPGRTESLLGLARSELLAGDDASAHATYQKLAALWHEADADARKAISASAGQRLPASAAVR